MRPRVPHHEAITMTSLLTGLDEINELPDNLQLPSQLIREQVQIGIWLRIIKKERRITLGLRMTLKNTPLTQNVRLDGSLF